MADDKNKSKEKDKIKGVFSDEYEIKYFVNKKKGEGKKPPLSISVDRNDTEYLRLTEYLYNTDQTDKTVFVLFYKLEVIEDDEIDNIETYRKKQNDNSRYEPIISRIFNDSNQDVKNKLSDNKILLLKVINPDNIILAPKPKGQDKDFPGHNISPPFTLEKGLKFIWDTPYHPFNWIKNKPRKKTNKNSDITNLENFLDKDGKPDIYPLLLIYKAGFPVMIYEGPYGELNRPNIKDEINQVKKILFKFIDKISKEGIPSVTDKDKWDSIFYELWNDYQFPEFLDALPVGFGDKDADRFKNEDIKLYYDTIHKEVYKETDYDKIIKESTFGDICNEEESENEYDDTNFFDYIYKPELIRKDKKTEPSKESKTKFRSSGLLISKPKPAPDTYIIEDLSKLNAVPSLKPLSSEQIRKLQEEEYSRAQAQQAQVPQQRPPQAQQAQAQQRPPQAQQAQVPQQRPPQAQQAQVPQQRPPQAQVPQQRPFQGQEPRKFEQRPPRS